MCNVYVQSEDRCDALNKELLLTKAQLLDTEEEMKRLESESQQVLTLSYLTLNSFIILSYLLSK